MGVPDGEQGCSIGCILVRAGRARGAYVMLPCSDGDMQWVIQVKEARGLWVRTSATVYSGEPTSCDTAGGDQGRAECGMCRCIRWIEVPLRRRTRGPDMTCLAEQAICVHIFLTCVIWVRANVRRQTVQSKRERASVPYVGMCRPLPVLRCASTPARPHQEGHA